MNNKGFTLVEVISIVVILALILVLTAPTYSTVSDNIKERNWASKKSVIEKQTIEFVNNYMKDDTYYYDVSDADGDGTLYENANICFSAGFLIRNGIITSEDEKREIIVNDTISGSAGEYTGDTIVIAVSYNETTRKLISYTITDKITSGVGTEFTIDVDWLKPKTEGGNCDIIYK